MKCYWHQQSNQKNPHLSKELEGRNILFTSLIFCSSFAWQKIAKFVGRLPSISLLFTFKAITTIRALLSKISITKIEKFLMKMIENFVTMESFTSKIAAATLIPIIYSEMQSSSQRALISFYIKMAQDEIPVVRKSISKNLKYFIGLIPKAPENQLITILQLFLSDDQDFVRMFVIESVINLAKVCNQDVSFWSWVVNF